VSTIANLINETKRAASTREITINPWRPALGAVVRGLRYDGAELNGPLRERLRDALHQYGALVFEPGTVPASHFTEFLGTFGEVILYSGPKTPLVSSEIKANVVDSSGKSVARNYLWHVDQGFRPNPPSYTALYGKEVPGFGGDTLFSNATAAYERLDPKFAAYLDTLVAVHSWDATGHLDERFPDPAEAAHQRALFPPIEAPVIRIHPLTGKKQILVNESYTVYIKGVSRTTSQNLLGILFEEIKSPEVEARYTWETDAVVVWDNRIVQHRGIGDFGDRKRVFYRACVA